MVAKGLMLLCFVSVGFSDGAVVPTEPTNSITESLAKTGEPCDSWWVEKGECVPYYKCNPRPTSDLEIEIRIPEYACESFLDVCCADSEIIRTTSGSGAEGSEAPK